MVNTEIYKYAVMYKTIRDERNELKQLIKNTEYGVGGCWS